MTERNPITSSDVWEWPGPGRQGPEGWEERERDQGEAGHFFRHWDEGEGGIPALEPYLRSYRQDLVNIMETYAGSLERGDLLSIVHIIRGSRNPFDRNRISCWSNFFDRTEAERGNSDSPSRTSSGPSRTCARGRTFCPLRFSSLREARHR